MPYILNTDQDREEMLKTIGVHSVEELYSHIPAQIKLKEPLNLSSGLTEFEVKKTVTYLSEKNVPLKKFNSFLGAGCYDHYVPSALSYILAQPQFLTAYTPYQAECSQGILQAIYEYQSYICILTGMDVSNASLFDGASSLAEAVLMALRIIPKKKIILCGVFHPEYRDTLNTYLSADLACRQTGRQDLSGFNFVIKEINTDKDGFIDISSLKNSIDNDTSCCVFQNPNFFGLIEDAEQIVKIAKEKGVLTVMSVNPISLAILKTPKSFGVDIVCGDGQPLGGSLNFGGPSFGFLAARKEYIRQMPGRLAGKTIDKEGNSAYCLTLQTREQHIRREKATSNICSNHSLNAIGAAIYLSLMGKKGLEDTALSSFYNTQYLYEKLNEIEDIKIPFPPRIFNEFVWQIKNAKSVIKKLYKKNIICGYYLGDKFPKYKNGILSCCTEKKTKQDIDNFVEELRKIT